jgi:hypothetical protein
MAVELRMKTISITYPERSQGQSRDRDFGDFHVQRQDQPLRLEDRKTNQLPASMAPCYCQLTMPVPRHSSSQHHGRRKRVLDQVVLVLFFEHRRRQDRRPKVLRLLR